MGIYFGPGVSHELQVAGRRVRKVGNKDNDPVSVGFRAEVYAITTNMVMDSFIWYIRQEASVN